MWQRCHSVDGFTPRFFNRAGTALDIEASHNARALSRHPRNGLVTPQPQGAVTVKPTIILALAAMGCLASVAGARENDAWEANPPEVRKWFQGLMQPDNPIISCCGESDAYYADSFEVDGDKYVAIITDTRDVPNRPFIKPGTKIVVPNNKLKYDAGNPTGHGVIFMNTIGTVYCFVVPGGV